MAEQAAADNIAILCHLETSLPMDVLSSRAQQMLAAIGHMGSDVSIVLTDDAEIAALNIQWRGVEGPTDVLSFPLDDPPAVEDGTLPGLLDGPRALGDVVISVETAERLVDSAEHRHRVAEEMGLTDGELGWDLLDEVTFLLVHGVLHLIGHDHAEPVEEARMKREEARVFAAVTG